MSRIQRQLAAIHLLTHMGEHVAVSDQALKRATAAFESLAGDIFCPDASYAGHPTQEQKELLHAVLAGAPLGAGASRAHLEAIHAHIRGASLTAPFSGAARAYLSMAPARHQAPPVPAQPPADSLALPPQMLRNAGIVIGPDRVSAKALTKRADGRRNLRAGDFEPLKQFELHLPGQADETAIAQGIEGFEVAPLHRAVAELARPYAYTGITHVKLISAYLNKPIWVWSKHTSGRHVEMSHLWSAGEPRRQHSTVDVLQTGGGNHFSPLIVERDAISDGEGQPRRVGLDHCAQAAVPGDGNCFYYAVAYATNRDGFHDAYQLVLDDTNAVLGAKDRLLDLVRGHTADDYPLNVHASAQQIFWTYSKHMAHNFRQDVADDILRRPDFYAAAINNRKRTEA